MQVWSTIEQQYEQASIQERENARATQCAADQAIADTPGIEVTDAKLLSRTVPLPNENLRIKGPRWYVKTILHNRNDGSNTESLYRVWRSEEGWKAAHVEPAH
jgi:hypothetical protein